MQDDLAWVPTTLENCRSVPGPFYHGTAAELAAGDLLVPGHASNYQAGRIANHVYFSATVASLAAQMATALRGIQGRGHVYVMEPTGPFEDDPNVTNKRFRGNPTKSYRTRHPLRIVGEVEDWVEHSPDVINGMMERLAALRKQGIDLIED
jgi:rifampin ADP-ribosylating transferase